MDPALCFLYLWRGAGCVRFAGAVFDRPRATKGRPYETHRRHVF